MQYCYIILFISESKINFQTFIYIFIFLPNLNIKTDISKNRKNGSTLLPLPYRLSNLQWHLTIKKIYILKIDILWNQTLKEDLKNIFIQALQGNNIKCTYFLDRRLKELIGRLTSCLEETKGRKITITYMKISTLKQWNCK